ncbi:MAG: DUF192 domain-containing protein [Trueperaceae bacterium]
MQATATVERVPLAQRLRWNDIIAPWLIRLAFLGVGILIGMYMLAPRQTRASDTYLPPAYVALPNGVVQIVNADGVVARLPVKVADTAAARNLGFANVGYSAIDNQLLLYTLTRETSARVTYSMNDVRAPLQVAVMGATGEVLAVHDVQLGTERLAVPELHRWLLVGRAGTFDALGIGVGSTLDPDTVQKVNY